jgi:hypothetical protein
MSEELAELGRKMGDELIDCAIEDEVADIIYTIKDMCVARASVAVACASILAQLVDESPPGLQRGAYAAMHAVIDSFLDANDARESVN